MTAATLVIIPTYNELENLERLVPSLLRIDQAIHLLIVDDNSPDGTGALADQFSNGDGRVHVIHRPAKLGLGTAYRTGFDFALLQGYERVVTMDADFSHPPERIPALLEAAKVFDLVIGSRYVAGGQVVGSPWSRRLLSRGANWAAALALGLQSRDCTAGFRCYPRQSLVGVDYGGIRSSGYSFLIEMLFLCQRAGYSVHEIPITFRDRAMGTSKISRREIGAALWTLLRLNWARLRHGTE